MFKYIFLAFGVISQINDAHVDLAYCTFLKVHTSDCLSAFEIICFLRLSSCHLSDTF